MALARELQQQPAEQKTDRQAAHVAQEKPRDRLVERSKAERRAQQRGRDQRGQRWIVPKTPNRTIAPVTGTISATVIQSMPSMKLTRLTSHTPPRSRQARSIHHGRTGRTRTSLGSAAITAPTAMNCSTSRSAAGNVRRSSMAPTKASRSRPR